MGTRGNCPLMGPECICIGEKCEFFIIEENSCSIPLIAIKIPDELESLRRAIESLSSDIEMIEMPSLSGIEDSIHSLCGEVSSINYNLLSPEEKRSVRKI